MTKYTFNSHFATDFEYIEPKNNNLTIVYLHGFCSDAWGHKPEVVKKVCEELGLGFVRFDYAGHGSDYENFARADFEVWKNQVFEVIENVVKGNFVMVGASMGGWLSLLTAIKYPERVRGVVGLAAAPNFVRRFEKIITDEQKAELEKNGYFKITNNDFTYTITARFIETAKASCLPEGENLWKIDCPVHLIQGMKDASVPWQEVLRYAQYITSEKVVVKLLKDANHRLNDEKTASEIRNSVINIVNIWQ